MTLRASLATDGLNTQRKYEQLARDISSCGWRANPHKMAAVCTPTNPMQYLGQRITFGNHSRNHGGDNSYPMSEGRGAGYFPNHSFKRGTPESDHSATRVVDFEKERAMRTRMAVLKPLRGQMNFVTLKRANSRGEGLHPCDNVL